jgi:hypothetical protein
MTGLDDSLAQYSIEAIRSSARPLGVDPLTLAKRLHQAEIFRLIHLLNAALPHVSTPGLRHRIEDLLSSVTNGQMPMFERAETELDWALQALRERRTRTERDRSSSEGEDVQDP